MMRLSPKEAPPFLASKWLHLDLLIENIEQFLEAISPVSIFSVRGVMPQGQNAISHDAFIKNWQQYIQSIKEGRHPVDETHSFFFTAIFTRSQDAIRALDLPDGREVVIPYEPIVQVQPHRFSYSTLDGHFRPLVFGENSISWGVRFSYPQLFQYPHTREVQEALDPEHFVNAELFLAIRQYVRNFTQPTPFLVNGTRSNEPIRLGKECFSWINNHIELKKRAIAILDVSCK